MVDFAFSYGGRRFRLRQQDVDNVDERSDRQPAAVAVAVELYGLGESGGHQQRRRQPVRSDRFVLSRLMNVSSITTARAGTHQRCL